MVFLYGIYEVQNVLMWSVLYHIYRIVQTLTKSFDVFDDFPLGSQN